MLTATHIPLRAWGLRMLVAHVLLLWGLGTPAEAETVRFLSRPSGSTWVVDGTGALSSETRAEVNRLGAEVDRSGLGQLVVAVVATTEGRSPRTFATELFNRWGLGHSRRDDGVLLFVALLDRKVEIILGDGVDTPEDVARSQELMRERVVPAFRRGDTDAAVLEGVDGLRTLLARAPLNKALGQQAVVIREASAPEAPAKPRVKEPRPKRPEPKEFLDDEGMYVDMSTSDSSEEEAAPASSAQVQEQLPSTEPSTRGESAPRASPQSAVSPWVWMVVVGFIVLLIVGNLLRNRRVTCERCGSTNVRVSTSTLLEATDHDGGLVQMTVRCQRCGHTGTSTRNRSARRHSHGLSSGRGSSSGRGASGSW